MLNKNKVFFAVIFLLASAMLLPACIGTARKVSETTAKAVFPSRDEVLIFHQAFDYTYLRVVDAILNTGDWTLYETDKREGLIRAYNTKWADPFGPMEQRIATVRVKRLERNRTAVELDSASQTLIGADDLMKSVKQFMNR
ncbi:MAG: hypothetical protein HY586_05905 [Candidatus Omnitrophica bacterium]|nr:hypothetical protein [Candidatus Omnitrophota bacterium]